MSTVIDVRRAIVASYEHINYNSSESVLILIWAVTDNNNNTTVWCPTTAKHTHTHEHTHKGTRDDALFDVPTAMHIARRKIAATEKSQTINDSVVICLCLSGQKLMKWPANKNNSNIRW